MNDAELLEAPVQLAVDSLRDGDST